MNEHAARTRTASATRRCAPGFTLIEVLVALLVMALGMLGIASLLLVTTRSNTSSIMKQQAVQSANNAIDRLRANRAVALANGYNANDLVVSGTPTYPAAPGADCSLTSCTSTQVAAYDIWYWLARDVAQLPLGCGSIATQPSGTNTLVTVTVQWDDSPAQRMLGAAASSPSGTPNIARLVVATLL